MRWVFLLVLVACDHRPGPPPKQQPISPPAAEPPVALAPPGDDACLQIGSKVAEIIISATTDPTQKAAYEQERTKLVKRFSDNCTREQWPQGARTCFLAAKTPADVEACSRQLPKPDAAPAPAPAPAPGSAAPTRD